MKTLKHLHVAYAGVHTTRHGSKSYISARQLQEVADSYDRSRHRCNLSVDDVQTAIALGAPAVLGHFDSRTLKKSLAMPAFGTVRTVYTLNDGNDLYLTVDLVDSMADWIQLGLYNRCSVGLYAPDEAGNPTPGLWHLKHIGFLGASPSAMKELDGFNIEYGESQTIMQIDADTKQKLMTLLEDGPQGYKGDIEDVMTVTPDAPLWNEDKSRFEGFFMGDGEKYTFSITEGKDGEFTRAYQVTNKGDAEYGEFQLGGMPEYDDEDENNVWKMRAMQAEATLNSFLRQGALDMLSAKLEPLFSHPTIAALGCSCSDVANHMLGSGSATEYSEVEISPTYQVLVAAAQLLKDAVVPEAVEFGEYSAFDDELDAPVETRVGPAGMKQSDSGTDLHNRALAYMKANGMAQSQGNYIKAVSAIA